MLIPIILVSDSSGLSRQNLLLRLICSAEIYLLRRTRSIAVLLELPGRSISQSPGHLRYLLPIAHFILDSCCSVRSADGIARGFVRASPSISWPESSHATVTRSDWGQAAPDGRGSLGSSKTRPRPHPVGTRPRAWRSQARHSGPAHWPAIVQGVSLAPAQR
jgi:hypothetical protein